MSLMQRFEYAGIGSGFRISLNFSQGWRILNGLYRSGQPYKTDPSLYI
jgi:hypothetical protein